MGIFLFWVLALVVLCILDAKTWRIWRSSWFVGLLAFITISLCLAGVDNWYGIHTRT
jgi:hypothetical protein